MSDLFDTDHISILQRESGTEFDALSARVAQHDPADLAFSVVSFHEQTLGCHTYLIRASGLAEVVRGYWDARQGDPQLCGGPCPPVRCVGRVGFLRPVVAATSGRDHGSSHRRDCRLAWIDPTDQKRPRFRQGPGATDGELDGVKGLGAKKGDIGQQKHLG